MILEKTLDNDKDLFISCNFVLCAFRKAVNYDILNGIQMLIAEFLERLSFHILIHGFRDSVPVRKLHAFC